MHIIAGRPVSRPLYRPLQDYEPHQLTPSQEHSGIIAALCAAMLLGLGVGALLVAVVRWVVA